MLYDFHTHTTLSDGHLVPIEQIRRAVVNGYAAVGLTDHVGLADCEHILKSVVAACATAGKYWNIIAIPGVELTHVPPEAIPEAARWARAHGAQIVVVHGETIVEPVLPGTNHAAVTCADIDILAHPGLLADEDAAIAAANDIFIEISARKGHSLTNSHVADTGRRAGARFLIGSDAHLPEELLSSGFARAVVLGAGLTGEEAATVLDANPLRLLERVRKRLAGAAP